MALVVLPLALVYMEGVELSLWFLFNTLLAFAVLADSGLSPTLLRAAAYFHNGAKELPSSLGSQRDRDEWSVANTEPNWEALHSLVATSGRMYGLVAVGSLLLLGVCGSAFAWNLMAMGGHNSSYWAAFVVLVVWACLQVQIARWSGILQGLGRVVQAKRIGAITNLLSIACFSFVLCSGYGVLGYACAGLVVVALNLFLMRKAVLSCLPARKAGKIHAFDKHLFLCIWPATWRLGLIKLGTFLVYHGSSLLIAQLPDPTQISAFFLTLRVITFIRQIATAPLVAYLPKVVASLACSELKAFRALTTRIVVLVLGLFLLESAALLLIGDRVLALLNVDTSLLPVPLLVALLLTFFMETHCTIHTTLYISTNHVPFALLSTVTGILMVLLSYALLDSYGVWGVILARIAVQLLGNYWYAVYLSLGITKWRFREYLSAIVTEGSCLCARLVSLRRKEGYA